MTTPWGTHSVAGVTGKPPSAAIAPSSGAPPGVVARGAMYEAIRASAEEGLPALHLLVVDDDDAVRNACSEIARKMGFVVVSAPDLDGARTILKHHKVDLLLLDLKLAGQSGLTLLEEVKILHAETSVVVMTAFATVASAVEAMRIGAGDYLTKPFALEELVMVLERAAERTHFDIESRRLRDKLRNPKGAGHLIGSSPEMEKLYRILSKVAHTNHPVLIVGESGTGKELVARSIHFNGPNASRPFIPVDCGSLVPEMIESELFGYVKGAFLGTSKSGATHSKEGLLTAAAPARCLAFGAPLRRRVPVRAPKPRGHRMPHPSSRSTRGAWTRRSRRRAGRSSGTRAVRESSSRNGCTSAATRRWG